MVPAIRVRERASVTPEEWAAIVGTDARVRETLELADGSDANVRPPCPSPGGMEPRRRLRRRGLSTPCGQLRRRRHERVVRPEPLAVPKHTRDGAALPRRPRSRKSVCVCAWLTTGGGGVVAQP